MSSHAPTTVTGRGTPFPPRASPQPHAHHMVMAEPEPEPEPEEEESSPARPRLSTASSSDFEFRPLPDPPDLPSADELFSRGFLLPLHPNPAPPPPPASSSLLPPDPPLTVPSRWKDLFRKQPRERKLSPELNIHLWPFSRSRSAGNEQHHRAPAAPVKKASSAPCSRSNSRGRWASSPARPAGGIHVGRASPVWRRAPNSKKAGDAKGGALNRRTCAGEHKDGVPPGGDRTARAAAYFGFRSLFFPNKKVY